MKAKSKSRKCLEWMYKGHSLTQEQSRKLFYDWRLSSIVKKARIRGWNILTIPIKNQRYVKYYMPYNSRNLAMAKAEFK